MKIIIYLLSLLGVALPFAKLSVPAESKQVVGWLEKACIYPGNLVIHAKLDTGEKFRQRVRDEKRIVTPDGKTS